MAERHLPGGCRTNPIEHLVEPERVLRTAGIERACHVMLDQVDHERRQIPHVDDLGEIRAISGRKDLAPSLDAYRPVAKAIGRISRSYDQARADDGVAIREGLASLVLGQRLGQTIRKVATRSLMRRSRE